MMCPCPLEKFAAKEQQFFLPRNLMNLISKTAINDSTPDCVQLLGYRDNEVNRLCITAFAVDDASPESSLLISESGGTICTAPVARLHVLSDDRKFDHDQCEHCKKSSAPTIFIFRDGKITIEKPKSSTLIFFYEPSELCSPFFCVESRRVTGILKFLLNVNDSIEQCCKRWPQSTLTIWPRKSNLLPVYWTSPVAWIVGLMARVKGASMRVDGSSVTASPSLPAVVTELVTKTHQHVPPSITNKEGDMSRLSLLELQVRTVTFQYFVDTILGVMFMIFLLFNQDSIVKNFTAMSEIVVQQLYVLLDWMMGVPAGLKLNTQLDVFLGKFFTYHVWLWAGFLDYQRNYLQSLVVATAVVGTFGLSVQLAFIRDILALSTMHLYCFYLYAARLYQMQTAALVSFWRLFRGKKWNDLRGRVDSAAYDVQQLFVGTLLFAVLLFLLPTVALYYIVFTVFRIAIFTIQDMLRVAIETLDYTYMYLLLLKMWGHAAVAGGDLDFKLARGYHQDSTNALYLQMKVKQASYTSMCQTLSLKQPPATLSRWQHLMRNVIVGHLI